jgi:membrane protein DedA with SNARE-associated domain
MNSDLYILLATFGSLVINGIFNFPSSQAIYLGAGVLLSNDQLFLAQLAIAGAAGNAIGNILLQYILLFASNTKLISRIGEVHIKEISKYVTHVTYFELYVAKLTPGIKVLVPYVAHLRQKGLYGMAVLYFFTSLVWAFALVYLGRVISEIPGQYKYVTLVAIIILISLIADRTRKQQKKKYQKNV